MKCKDDADHKDTCRLFGDLGACSITVTFPHGLGNAGKYFLDVIPRYEDTIAQLYSSLEYYRARNVTIKTEAYPYCMMEGYEEHVTELYFNDEPINLKQHGHKEFQVNWFLVRLTEKAKFSQCREQSYECICEGPWRKYPEKYGNHEFRSVAGTKLRSRGAREREDRRTQELIARKHQVRH